MIMLSDRDRANLQRNTATWYERLIESRWFAWIVIAGAVVASVLAWRTS